jgi:molybdenum cofactor cytidylyltransferase
MADTVAILLAAGESSRMGRPKALLPWRGATLLAHQLEALSAGGVDETVVVLGHRPEDLQPILEGRSGVTGAINPDYAQGKTTSIKAGLAALGQDQPGVILLLHVDQPRSPETIRQVLLRHAEGRRLITIPAYRGKGGHPIALDPSLLPELRGITEETLGVKSVVRAHQDSTLRTEMSTPEVLWDLNTPEEYKEALTKDG